MEGVFKELWEKKVVRFFFVGSFNFLLDIVMLNIFISVFGLRVLVANSLSVSIGITASYFLNHRIVFRHPQNYSLKAYGKFFVVTGFSAIIIQDFIIGVLAPRVVRVHPGEMVGMFGHSVPAQTIELNVAKIVAVAIGMVWNFLLYKYIVFRHNETADRDDEIIVV